MTSTITNAVDKYVTLGANGYTSPLTITSTGQINGPEGAPPAAGQMIGNAGQSALLMTSGMVSNAGFIDGGQGGEIDYAGSGTAGAGATALVMQGGVLINTGYIVGGVGGAGDALGPKFKPNGGAGGAGAVLSGGTLINDGYIAGGIGGSGLKGGTSGAGGLGVLVNGGTVVNNGTISGRGDGVRINNGVFIDDGVISNKYQLVTYAYGAAAATVLIESGAVITNKFIAHGGHSTFGVTGTAPFTLSDAGHIFYNFNAFTFASTIGGFGLSANAAYIDGGEPISGMVAGDNITLTGFAATSESFAAANELVLKNSGGTGVTLDLTGFTSTGELKFSNDGSNTTLTALIGTISTAISPGITLGTGSYANILLITNTGAVTGAAGNLAISGPAASSLDNQGVVEGGAGSNGAGGNPFGSHPGGAGGAAAAGVSLAGAFITNTGTVAGGTGGTGGNGAVYRGAFFGDGANGGAGGAGGAGLVLNGGAGVNQGVIAGGAGGVGGNGGYGFGYYNGGNGGNGGTGLLLSGGAMLTNAGTVMGGAGGAGGNGHHNGGGGAAGTGAYVNGGTLVNAGTISGSNAVLFGPTAGTLVVESGAVFNGAVVANSAVADVLEFSGTSVSDFTGIGDSVLNFNQISFATGAAWTIAGDAAGLASGQTIANFLSGNTIDLTDIAAATETFANGVLTLVSATGAVLADLILNEPAGKASTNTFLLASDGNGGTDITSIVPCFCAGTRIRTPRGEIAVEALAVGDEVITRNGPQRIKWIGHRNLDLSRHPHPENVRPVLLSAGCLADNIPCRDLFLSPDHALYIDGLLVPAKALLNGATIRQLTVPSVTYYHIELENHSVIFAENTPAETYLETGNRGAFENGGGAITVHPDFAQTTREAKSCAPIIESGPRVEEIRRRILARADISTTDDPAISIAYDNGAAIIQSRCAIPGLITPDPRDRRLLGVKIAAITIGGRDIPFEHPALVEGWYDAEPDGRWTDGNAVIPAGLLAGGKDVTVSITATLPYPIAA